VRKPRLIELGDALTYLQSRFSVDPQHSLDVNDYPFAPQQHRQSTEPESPAFSREFLKPRSHWTVVLDDAHVANHAPIHRDEATSFAR
jgi:hypothetical protein